MLLSTSDLLLSSSPCFHQYQSQKMEGESEGEGVEFYSWFQVKAPNGCVKLFDVSIDISSRGLFFPPARQFPPFRLPATPNNVTIGEMFYHLMSERQKILTESDLAPPFDKKIDFSPRSDSRPIFASESCFFGVPGRGTAKSTKINKINRNQ